MTFFLENRGDLVFQNILEMVFNSIGEDLMKLSKELDVSPEKQEFIKSKIRWEELKEMLKRINGEDIIQVVEEQSIITLGKDLTQGEGCTALLINNQDHSLGFWSIPDISQVVVTQGIELDNDNAKHGCISRAAEVEKYG